ncbi:acylphosphate phosphohydrolase [Geomicrobium sp. JCM 19037]|uniref:acylphosphatase n=1 Tax=unclassified Geomicrobium TaxID=2628951 RepID=UPI00045F4BFD|nr:acylphosphatase [Geomicrobium sp. JCM 19037]GAK06066.1 acylphosphate phosphohydrolase [Geomicrobium sp. JCM 19037]
MIIKKQMVASGRVQGVGFRQFVYEEAKKHHLYGSVRNRNDGAVDIEVEGTNEKVTEWVTRIKQGNGFSEIRELTSQETDEINHNKTFSIRYD